MPAHKPELLRSTTNHHRVRRQERDAITERSIMQEAINRLRRRQRDEDGGFTLIELLVVVVIIGILVAIAVPVYLNYRKGAANKSAMSDVRGAISAVEQYYTENGNKLPATVVGTEGVTLDFAAATGTPQKASVSPGNTLSYADKTTYYVICGTNSDGGAVYVYNSSTGGSVKKSGSTTLAACVTAGS
jgi:type IV pilus assembly protein PilA